MASCTKHLHEHATGTCRRCADEWCHDCLVYTYGPAKAPYCLSCAMVAAGVRSTASRPAASRRQLRQLRQSERAALRAARSADPAGETAAAAEVAAAELAGLDPRQVPAAEPAGPPRIAAPAPPPPPLPAPIGAAAAASSPPPPPPPPARAPGADGGPSGTGIDWSARWWEVGTQQVATAD